MSSRADLFSAGNAQRLTVDGWQETATASNDVATLDKSGVTAKHLHVTSIHASFVGSTARTAPATMVVTLGYLGTELTFSVIQNRDLVFSPALRLPVGESLEISLSAGGSGQQGHLIATGFTL